MTRIAGYGPRGERGEPAVLHVDYAVVMRQAVENERAKVLREVRAQVEALETRDAPSGRYDWDRKELSASTFKRSLLARLAALESS